MLHALHQQFSFLYILLSFYPGARFSKVARTFHARKVSYQTAICFFWEGDLVFNERKTKRITKFDGLECRRCKDIIGKQGPVSRKSRNFSGVFRVTQFSLYLQNEGVSRHETLQLFLFLFPLQHMKRPALQNKQVVVLRLAFRARNVSGLSRNRRQARKVAGLLRCRPQDVEWPVFQLCGQCERWSTSFEFFPPPAIPKPKKPNDLGKLSCRKL